MNARLARNLVVAIAGVLLVVPGAGCDWIRQIDDPNGPLAPTSTRKPALDASAPDAGVVVVADAAAPLSEGYAAMCSHYCKTLEETDVFACAANGREVQACRDIASSTPARCFDLRCVPQLVDLSLCFAQCDSVATFYVNRCPVAGDPTDSLCMSSHAAHDAACRAGCVL